MSTIHPHHRRSIRLVAFDYTSAGGYFLTLATHQNACLFGAITGEQVSLNTYGDIVQEEWLHTPQIRPNIILDEYIIMPNHLHGIIFITEPDPVEAHSAPPTHRNSSSVGAHSSAPLRKPNKSLFRPPKSLGSFVAGFKSIVTERINILRSTPGMPVWQRNYYEHIISPHFHQGVPRCPVSSPS
jgi:REP element-mobilizing transposase RayT